MAAVMAQQQQQTDAQAGAKVHHVSPIIKGFAGALSACLLLLAASARVLVPPTQLTRASGLDREPMLHT